MLARIFKMQHEQIIDMKTHKFVLTIETTKKNVRDFIEQMVEEYGNDVYFNIEKVEVIK